MGLVIMADLELTSASHPYMELHFVPACATGADECAGSRNLNAAFHIATADAAYYSAGS